MIFVKICYILRRYSISKMPHHRGEKAIGAQKNSRTRRLFFCVSILFSRFPGAAENILDLVGDHSLYVRAANRQILSRIEVIRMLI